MRKDEGVTLIEITVVMAIVVIMSLFMVPSLVEWLDNYRVRQGARDIVSHLQFAKMRAIASRLEYRVSFDLEKDEYLIERREAGVWLKEGDPFRTPRGVDIAASSGLGNPPRVEFNPNGTASSGHIKITNSQGKSYKVIVTSSGRIRMQDV